MEVKIVIKESFAVIGKEGQGPSDRGKNWIPPLWQAANGNFGEINGLAKLNENGQPVGIWGAMSDIGHSFEPWSEKGSYLAGCEVRDEAIAPEGWTKWVIPYYRYAVVKCTHQTYGEIFSTMLADYFPRNGYNLAGAVHEYYSPSVTNDELYLYFPIERL